MVLVMASVCCPGDDDDAFLTDRLKDQGGVHCPQSLFNPFGLGYGLSFGLSQ